MLKEGLLLRPFDVVAVVDSGLWGLGGLALGFEAGFGLSGGAGEAVHYN